MGNYWLKDSSDASPLGPYTGSQLKSMAATGQLSPSAYISQDNAKWFVASKVKGLFPEAILEPDTQESRSPPVAPPAVPVPHASVVPTVALPTAPQQDPSIQPPSVPLTYMRNVGLPVRNLQWFLISSIVLVVLGIGARVAPFMLSALPSRTITTSRVLPNGSVVTTRRVVPNSRTVPLAIAMLVGIGIVTVGMIALLIYFTVWAYRVHREFRQFTNAAYPTTPGQACGFCYIPFFNLYWVCAMPFKLAEAVDWHLGSTRRQTNPTTVLICQILGVVLGWCIPGLHLLFFAISMRSIQNGLNQLWSQSPAPLAVAQGWQA